MTYNYVSEADHENEREILDRLKSVGWISDYTTNQHDQFAHIDSWATRPDRTQVGIECRYRADYSMEQMSDFGGVYINCDKFWSAVKQARSKARDLQFAVMLSDGLWVAPLYRVKYDNVATDPETGLGWMQNILQPRRRRKSNTDVNEECFAYGIPKGMFTLASANSVH